MSSTGRRPLVLVTYDPGEAARAVIGDVLDGAADVRYLPDLDDPARADALASAEALITWAPSRDLRPDELPAAARLRLIQLMSAGADTVDFDAVPATLIVAANVGAYAQPMAEHVLGMTLALAKRLPANHARLAAGEYPADPETTELRGAVAGIVGFGGIGRACADLLRPLGVRIHAINTSGRTDADVEFVGGPADLERVLRAADVVVVAIPLTLGTRGLIGARELAWMKPTASDQRGPRGDHRRDRALRAPGRDAGVLGGHRRVVGRAGTRRGVPPAPAVPRTAQRAGIPAQLRHRRGHDRTRGGRRCTQRRPLPPGRAAPGGPAPGDYSSSARIE